MSSNSNLSMESEEKRWYYSQINHIDNMLKKIILKNGDTT